MRILAFIKDEEVIEKILKHLGLWDLKVGPPPKVEAPPMRIQLDYSDSQISSSDSFYAHPDYPVDFYRISKPHGVTRVVVVSGIDPLFSYHRKCFGMILNYSIGVPDFQPGR
jgi:hypothetical protein